MSHREVHSADGRSYIEHRNGVWEVTFNGCLLATRPRREDAREMIRNFKKQENEATMSCEQYRMALPEGILKFPVIFQAKFASAVSGLSRGGVFVRRRNIIEPLPLGYPWTRQHYIYWWFDGKLFGIIGEDDMFKVLRHVENILVDPSALPAMFVSETSTLFPPVERNVLTSTEVDDLREADLGIGQIVVRLCSRIETSTCDTAAYTVRSHLLLAQKEIAEALSAWEVSERNTGERAP